MLHEHVDFAEFSSVLPIKINFECNYLMMKQILNNSLFKSNMDSTSVGVITLMLTRNTGSADLVLMFGEL